MFENKKYTAVIDKISIDIANMIYEVAESLVSEYHVLKDFESFNVECIKYFGIESPFSEQEFKSGKEDDLTQNLFEAGEQHYRKKSAEIAEMVFPVVRDVYTNPNNNFENIVTPFTDGIRGIQVMANLKKSFETNPALEIPIKSSKEYLRIELLKNSLPSFSSSVSSIQTP